VPSEGGSSISSRLQVNEMPSAVYFHVARLWLTECQDTHPGCGNDVPELPSRVLYVVEEGQPPFLVNGEGIYAHYATLSYCWGQSRAVKTTVENLEQLQNAIPLDTLPETFRDAMLVCRQLGIRYLWVDNICIVQNSTADWEKQSSAMGSIYYNSTITLAATASSDSSTGMFLPKRHYEDTSSDFVTLPSSFGGNKGQVYLTALSPGFSGDPARIVQGGI
jgi:hypothetical protein